MTQRMSRTKTIGMPSSSQFFGPLPLPIALRILACKVDQKEIILYFKGATHEFLGLMNCLKAIKIFVDTGWWRTLCN
jgi:hypothetical protein